MVKNLPCKAGDVGWNPDYGTKIPHGEEQPSHVQQRESVSHKKRPRNAVKTSPTTTETHAAK